MAAWQGCDSGPRGWRCWKLPQGAPWLASGGQRWKQEHRRSPDQGAAVERPPPAHRACVCSHSFPRSFLPEHVSLLPVSD